MSTIDTDNGPAGKNKKYFVPLENNPEVFQHLAQSLGLSPALKFHDVYSIDEPSLLAVLPRPAHALIFIAPAEVYHKRKRSDFPPDVTNKHDLPGYTGSGEAEPVLWYKQTIGHSCGLMALLHGVSNGEARSHILPESDLDKIIKAPRPLEQAPRAQLLYDSMELEKAHREAAHKGDTVAPSSEDPNGFHFISFVRGKDDHLWELEGGWVGPVDRGPLHKDSDMLSEDALDRGVRPYLEAAKGGKGIDGGLGFSIIVLVPRDDEW